MTYPNEELQEVHLKLLFNLFKVKLPKWYPEFISGKNMKKYWKRIKYGQKFTKS
jgi:hypothetical protein